MKHTQQSERLLPGPSHARMPATVGRGGSRRHQDSGGWSRPLSISIPPQSPPLQETPAKNIHDHTCTLTPEYTHSHTCLLKCTQAHAQIPTHTHTHTHHTHTDRHTHAHISTYLYTHIPRIGTCTHIHIHQQPAVFWQQHKTPQPAQVQEGSRGKQGHICLPVQTHGPKRGPMHT